MRGMERAQRDRAERGISTGRSLVAVHRDELEARWKELGEFIRAQRELTEMSVRRLAQSAGVSNPYLSQIERGLRKPSAEILQQIARALSISAEGLYVRAGILDPDDSNGPSVIEAIQADRRLSADQKHTLLTVYRSFAAQSASGASGANAGHSVNGSAPPATATAAAAASASASASASTVPVPPDQAGA
jgi:transcriptional regulator with XRE-family HTH domain